jgi:hypothetical protein
MTAKLALATKRLNLRSLIAVISPWFLEREWIYLERNEVDYNWDWSIRLLPDYHTVSSGRCDNGRIKGHWEIQPFIWGKVLSVANQRANWHLTSSPLKLSRHTRRKAEKLRFGMWIQKQLLAPSSRDNVNHNINSRNKSACGTARYNIPTIQVMIRYRIILLLAETFLCV